MLYKAQELLESGKPADAILLLEKDLATAPDDPYLLLYAGLAQVELGRVEEGLAALERACTVEPVDPLRRIFLARALYDTGRPPGAVEQCRRVEGAQPGHPGAVTLRLLCQGEEDPLPALTALSLLGLPGDPELQGRALAFAESVLAGGTGGAHEQSRAREPVDLWPNGVAPWNVHSGVETALPELSAAGGLWMKQSQARQAAGALERAIVFGEAGMREQGGAKTPAVSLPGGISESPPESSPETNHKTPPPRGGGSDEARVHLALLYFEAGRWAEVEAALRGFLPSDPERNTCVGVSLAELGRLEQAIPVLEQAEPESARAAHWLGRARLLTGDPTAARRAFVRTARLDEAIPHDRVARAYLAARAAALTAPARI